MMVRKSLASSSTTLYAPTFIIQTGQPVCQGLPVFMRESRVNQRQRKKLSTLVKIFSLLTSTEKNLGKKFHVFFPGLGIARMEQRNVGEELMESKLFCFAV